MNSPLPPRTEAPRATATIRSRGEFDAEETYVGGGDVERGFRHIDDVDENNALVRFIFTPRIRIGILRLGAGFERYDFNMPSRR